MLVVNTYVNIIDPSGGSTDASRVTHIFIFLVGIPLLVDGYSALNITSGKEGFSNNKHV